MKEFKYTIDGKEYNVEIGDINEETYVASVKVNGEAYEVGMEKPAEPEKKKVELGKPVAESNEESAAPATNANVANATKAPLPGTITAINVNVGDEVKAGDAVLVLEAMKMENTIKAGTDGTVKEILVSAGDAVADGAPLVVIE